MQEFPFYESVIAPYMADLDTTSQGHITYRESQDSKVLDKANSDIQRAFPEAAKDFEGASVLIATWKNVKGFSLEGEVRVKTNLLKRHKRPAHLRSFKPLWVKAASAAPAAA